MWKRKWCADGHAAPVYSCCTDGSWIYSSAGDRFVTRWNMNTGEQDQFAIKLDSPAYTITAFGELLIIGCMNGTIVAVSTLKRSLAWEINFRGKAIFSLASFPEHEFLLAGDETGELLVISPAGALLAGFPLNCGKIRQIRKSDDRIFLACQDGNIRVLELPSFNETNSFHAHKDGVNSLLVFPASHTVLSVGRDAHLRLWDLVTNKELEAIPAHYQNIYGLEQCGESELVSVSMDKIIKIWDMHELKVKQRIEFKQGGHNRSVNGCAVIDENHFVTYGDDKRVILWEREF